MIMKKRRINRRITAKGNIKHDNNNYDVILYIFFIWRKFNINNVIKYFVADKINIIIR